MAESVSPRQRATGEIYAALEKFDLLRPYGDDRGYSQDKKYRTLLFCRPANLDGEIRVYSPKWILVSWQTRYHNLPHKGQEKFTSVKETIDFLHRAFVKYE